MEDVESGFNEMVDALHSRFQKESLQNREPEPEPQPDAEYVAVA